MNFSDINNQSAAHSLIERFKKKFRAKACSAPGNDCSGQIISAHTLSAKAMLLPISANGHVYAQKVNFFAPNDGKPVKLDLVGIKNTSVFNGFCAKHDKELFAPIEDKHFLCESQQIFMHAYRAIAREHYLKSKAAEPLVTLETIRDIHGIGEDVEMGFAPDELIRQAAVCRGAVEMRQLKEAMDRHLTNCDWRRIMTTVIPFKRPPTFVCSSVFSPSIDFSGSILQDYADFDTDLSQLVVTIFPAGNVGYALLSHLDTANDSPRKLIASLLSQDDVTSSLLWLVLCYSENIAISPTWYESLANEQIQAIEYAYRSGTDPYEVEPATLMACKLFVESWDPGKPFDL